MDGLTPNCLDDFLLSNASERDTVELILSRKLPFPFSGKSGILLHGTWGTGKTTFANLLPCLLEAAHDPNCNLSNGIGQMPAEDPANIDTIVIPCGNGATSTSIAKTINDANSHYPFFHNSKHDWLPLARRILNDSGVTGVNDSALLPVIEAGKGSARDILDGIVSVVLNIQSQATNNVV